MFFFPHARSCRHVRVAKFPQPRTQAGGARCPCPPKKLPQRHVGHPVLSLCASHAVSGSTVSALTVRWTRASCDSALEINTSVKGLCRCRRSQAFHCQRLFDEALRDCQAAVAMGTKNNTGIAAFLVTVQKQVDGQSKKEKAFHGEMFG